MSAHDIEPVREPRWLFCECENCTERWTEYPPYVGSLRCPNEDCGSKNVHVAEPTE